jgi:hypothetical protein
MRDISDVYSVERALFILTGSTYPECNLPSSSLRLERTVQSRPPMTPLLSVVENLGLASTVALTYRVADDNRSLLDAGSPATGSWGGDY